MTCFSTRLVLPQVLFEIQHLCFDTLLLFLGLRFIFGVIQNHPVVHITLAHQVGGEHSLLEELLERDTFGIIAKRNHVMFCQIGTQILIEHPETD